MEKERKELKLLSIVILAFVALSVVKSIVDLCVNGLPQAKDIPEGFSVELFRVISIIMCIIGFIVYIPQIYVGIKGLQIANGANYSGKAHIIWAIILAVFAGIGVISGITEIFNGFKIVKLLNVLDTAIDVALYVYYIRYARSIA